MSEDDMKSCFDKRYYILDESLPFSQSSLWDSVRHFYSEKGPAAWQEGLVPSHITSNCFIANNYASLLLSFMYDSKNSRKNEDEVDEPVYIFEIGAGHGKFGYLVIKKILEQQANSPELYGELKFVYVMTDFAFSNIKFWHNHPKLKEFVAMGLMDFALFDCEHDTDVTLFHSQRKISFKSLKNDVVVIGNYIFDSLRCEHFRLREGILEEGLITVVVPNEAAEKNLKEEIAKEAMANSSSKETDGADAHIPTMKSPGGDGNCAPAEIELVSNLPEPPTPSPNNGVKKFEPMDLDKPPPCTDQQGNTTKQTKEIFPKDLQDPGKVGPRTSSGTLFDSYMSIDDGTSDTPKIKTFHRLEEGDRLKMLHQIDPNKLLHWFDYITFEPDHRPLSDNTETMDYILKLYLRQLVHSNHEKTEQERKRRRSSLANKNGSSNVEAAMNGEAANSSEEEPVKEEEESERDRIVRRNQFNTSFLYPTGVNQCIERMRSWSHGACMVITADKGYTTKCGPSGLREPHLAMHGCISTMVNFHAVAHYVRCHGGFAMSSELNESSIKVSTYVFPSQDTPLLVTVPEKPSSQTQPEPQAGVPAESSELDPAEGLKSEPDPASVVVSWDTPPPLLGPSPIKSHYPDLQRMFNTMINAFGPYDFFSLEVCITREIDQPSANLALRLLRLSCYDPDVYYRFADAFLGEDVITDPSLQDDISRAIDRTWENFYYLEKDHDIAFQIARYFFVLEDYETALEFFDYSLEEIGESYCTIFDKGLCLYYSNKFSDAKIMFKRSIEINPEIDEKANEWVMRCERAEEMLKNCTTATEILRLQAEEKEVMTKPLPDITKKISAVIPEESIEVLSNLDRSNKKEQIDIVRH